MGTLSSELAPVADSLSPQPRVYVDANVPAGLVAYMRDRLRWDVLFVMEHADLRRASDPEHFHLAHQLRRTLITLDRDYLDDRKFPPTDSGGVLVLAAPDEGRYVGLLKRLNTEIFSSSGDAVLPLPLAGRKLHVHVDWAGTGETAQP